MSKTAGNKSKALRAVLLAAVAAVLSTTAHADGSLAGKTVTLVTCGTSNPWCKVFNDQITSKLKDAGVKVNVLENDFDAVLEVQQMNEAISQQPDLIMVEPADDKTLVGSAKKAKAAGVPVLYMDSPADPAIMDDIAFQVIADNVALGRFAGQNIIDGLRELGLKKANVIVISGTKGSTMVQDRQRGFEEVMATAPEYKVIDVQDGNWDPVLSGNIAQQLFAKYQSQGGIQAVRAEADYTAIPVIQAARQAGMKVGVAEGGLIVSGTNCTKAGIDSIRAGEMYGTATEDAFTQGEYTVDAALKFLRGEKVEKTIVVPEYRVTKATLGQYSEVCSKG
ncbi:MAG: sugar ABC transporter substrate-binding protein [Parvibaculaceae bacterium]|nr:sugar ABC transporter substrate-binding protein [Parvibaculaceae bacterium]